MTIPENVVKILPNGNVVPLQRARYWVQAVEYQARRVVATHAASYDLRTSCHMEEQFLLTAVQKARRWLNESTRAGNLAADTRKRIDFFLKATSAAKDLRDIREHDDEYDLGRGKHRDKIDTTLRVDGRSFEMSHAFRISYRDGDMPLGDMTDIAGLHLLLGGRFDVVTAISVASTLAEYLISQENGGKTDASGSTRFVGPSFPPADDERGTVGKE